MATSRSQTVGPLGVALSLITLLVLPPAASATPSIAWIFPAGGQRGTTVMLTVAGDNLADVKGFFATGAGLKADALPVSEPLHAPLVSLKPGEKPQASDAKKYRQFKIAIAPDAPLGRQEVRVFDQTGASNPRYFQVGDQPEIVEQEPNDDSTGQLVNLPVVVNGRIQQDTDQDIYTFHGKKGQRIVGEVYGLRSLGMIGDSWLKGYMELRDGAGKVLAANEGYYRWDPMIASTLPADGDYSFMFRELTYRGAESAVYRLSIGALPRATALYPAGGRRGSTVPVTFIGENLGRDPTQTVTIPANAPLAARDERLQTAAGWTNPLPFQVGDLPEVMEREPNDRRAQAMPVSVPVTINGRIDRPGDVDSFRFKVTKGQRLILGVLANRAESPLDPFLRLWDSDANVVEENDDARERDSRIERTFDSDGEYVLQVRDLDERGGSSFVYRLTIAPPHADFTVTATPDKPLVGAGGTAVLDLAVDRNDGFEGDVAVGVADLPPGLTATSTVIRKGNDRGRLTVTAARDLPVQALALHVVGKATLDGHEEHRIAGTTETYNIQGTAFTRDLTGPIATAGAPVPLALTAEPAVLSPKGGETITLTVRAQRSPEAAGEISVQLPNLPEGVTAEPVKIAPGSTTAQVSLKVDVDAPAANVDLVATGETKEGDATRTATSPALLLTIVEAPGFTLTVEPKELSAAQGDQAEHNFTAKVKRRGGFDGPIDLEWVFGAPILTLPAGHIEAGKQEAKVALKLPAALTAGAVDVKLVGKATVAGGERRREATVKLTVTAAKAGGK